MVGFGALCESSERVNATRVLQDTQASNVAAHGDEKAWRKWSRPYRKAMRLGQDQDDNDQERFLKTVGGGL
jgi:hypothetical protein